MCFMVTLQDLSDDFTVVLQYLISSKLDPSFVSDIEETKGANV